MIFFNLRYPFLAFSRPATWPAVQLFLVGEQCELSSTRFYRIKIHSARLPPTLPMTSILRGVWEKSTKKWKYFALFLQKYNPNGYARRERWQPAISSDSTGRNDYGWRQRISQDSRVRSFSTSMLLSLLWNRLRTNRNDWFCPLQGMTAFSKRTISFHRLTPFEFRFFDFLIYDLISS